jgi:tetratricopeptide (TPR) repeat protein
MLVWDPTSEAQERRRFTVLETAARLYPRDPEIWEQLGEARIHFGDRVGATPEQALAAFEQAVALDPGYNPPYFHVIELAAEMRSVDSVARLVAQVRASAPDDSRYRVLAPMLKDLATGHFTAALPRDGPRLEDVVSAAYLLHRWMGDPFASEQLLRAVLESPRADAGPLRETVRNRLVNELLYHAKPDEAARVMAPATLPAWPARALALGQMRALGRDSANRLFRRWLESPKPAELLATLPWWGDQRDVPSLARARHRFDSLAAGAPGGSAQRESGRYGAGAAAFYALLAGRDTARALATALLLADSLCTLDCAPERLATARLLRLRGRAAEGGRLLDRHPPRAATITVTEVEWHLERARLATAARDDATARRSYSFVARAWREAEPSLQPAAAEARDWLAAHR